jgi:putative hemolysin
MAAFFVPPVVWMLRHTHRLLEFIALQTNHFRDLSVQHSRLYEKEDLLDLIQQQKEQGDNRIQQDDLDLVEQALRFGDIRAADIVLPRKQAYLVDADDNIGPILLDQLHKQKQQSFLVYKDEKENIIGSLALADAVTAKKGGRVFDLIRSDLIFVHEDFTARQVLNAFHKTGHQVAVVINNAEEFVGVITITLNHLLHKLLGEAQEEDVPYGDRGAVAAYQPKQETKAQSGKKPSLESDQQILTDQEVAVDDMHDETDQAAEIDQSADEAAPSPEATEVVK